MSAVRSRAAELKGDLTRKLLTRLVRTGRIQRHAYQHYFIEDEGLHSRIHLQNFWSTFWPHVHESRTARIDVYAPAGDHLGTHRAELEPFGSLFLEARDLLRHIGADVPEGSVTIDLAPPQQALEELARFPVPDPWELRIQTPFWMAYYDDDENYMYVHSIAPYSGAVYGLSGPLARVVTRAVDPQGSSWRSGRLIDAAGVTDIQVVAINHANAARTAEVGIFDADGGDAVWTDRVDLGPHELRRVHVDLETVAAFARSRAGAQFQIGIDPLMTPNGKPYVLMRYGDGPLSLHHG